MKRICNKCKKTKDINEFYHRSNGCIVSYSCKECDKKRVKLRYYTYGREQIRQYEYKRVRDPIRKAKHKIYDDKWKKKNPEKLKEIRKNYKAKIKKLGIGEFSLFGQKRVSELKLLRHHIRYKNDINYKLAMSLRNRMRIAIKGNQKVGSAVKDLGCSVNELKKYLESKFTDGMTWDNWGEWHIDHIKPLSSFDLSEKYQYLQATHYTNLQPLWAKDNLVKNKSRTI